MWRARGVIRGQALQLALALHPFGIGRHDLCRLAMQRERDLRSLGWKALARRLHAAHDELEVRVVVALLRSDHQEVALAIGAAMQAMRAVEHENLERRDAMALNELGDLTDMRRVH